MSIYIDRNNALKNEMIKNANTDGEPMEVISHMMRLNNELMTKDPILCIWYDREVFKQIEKKFIEEKGLEQVNFVYDFL